MSFTYARDLPFGPKMMWAGVLRRAVFDYVLFEGRADRKLEWRRALQYVFTEGQRYENGLGFEEVCELFGWDPDYLRRMTTQLTRADIKKMDTSQFRDEFVYDAVKIRVEQTERWLSLGGAAAPFLPNYQYNSAQRKKVQAKTISSESCGTMPFMGESRQVSLNG